MAELLGTHQLSARPEGAHQPARSVPRCFRGRGGADARPRRLPLLLPQGRVGRRERRGPRPPPLRSARRARTRACSSARPSRSSSTGRGGSSCRNDCATEAGIAQGRRRARRLRPHGDLGPRGARALRVGAWRRLSGGHARTGRDGSMRQDPLSRGGSTEPLADRDHRRDDGGGPRPRVARRPPVRMRRGMPGGAGHEPVMVGEVVRFLEGRGTVLDLTLGAGGHAEALLGSGVERLIGSTATRTRSRSRAGGSPGSATASTPCRPGSRTCPRGTGSTASCTTSA